MGYGLTPVKVQMQHYLETYWEAAIAADYNPVLSHLRRQESALRSVTSERTEHLCSYIAFYTHVHQIFGISGPLPLLHIL